MSRYNQSKLQTGQPINRQIHIMVTAADRRGHSLSRTTVDLFRAEQERIAGLPPSPWQEETDEIVAELRRIRSEIWRIGHNINQIAHVANRDVRATGADEYSAAMAARNIDRLLGDVRGIIDGMAPPSDTQGDRIGDDTTRRERWDAE